MQYTLKDLDHLLSNKYQALMLSKSGTPVFPVNHDYKSKYYKRPLTANGFYDATANESQVKQFWVCYPEAMIGVPTGHETGLILLDIDVKNGVNGFTSLEKLLIEKSVVLPRTFTVETISGGEHRIFSIPDEFSEKCIKSRIGLVEGVDIKADGGYMIHPPSTNSEDQSYSVIDDSPIAPCPPEFIEIINNYKIESLNKLPLNTDGKIKEGERNHSITKLMGNLFGLGLSIEQAYEIIKVANAKLCSPALEEWEVQSIAKSIGSRDRGYSHTAIGNGQRFAERHEKNVKSVNNGNKNSFYIWDGNKWELDRLGKVQELAKVIAIDLQAEAEMLMQNSNEELQKIGKSLFTLSKKAQDNPSKIVTMAATDPKIAIRESSFNQLDHIAPCMNGYIDLNNCTFHEHDAGLYYTKLFRANFDENANNELWNNFINDFSNQNQEINDFLARCYGGLGLVGGNPEQKMLLLFGEGGNGKSTLHEILRHVMSEYSDVLRKEVLASNSNRDYRQDIADLKNTRFVTVSEPSEDFQINSSLLKDITGGDTLKGRQNYADSETFQCKAFVACASNWELSLNNGDEAVQRRLLVYRSPNAVPQDKRINNLVEKVCNAPDGVLMWLLYGRRQYLKNLELKNKGLLKDALNPPAIIAKQTQEYFDRQDLIRSFIQKRCRLGEGLKTQASKLFEEYSGYCMSLNEKMPQPRKFYEIIEKKFAKTSQNGCSFYLGIAIK